MDTENETDSSTVPVTTPSPPHQTAPPLDRLSPSSATHPSQPLAQSSEEENQQAQSSLHPSKTPTSPQIRPQGRSERLPSLDESAETPSKKRTKISPRERSPIAVQTAEASGSRLRRSERSPQTSPRTRSQSSDLEVVTQTSVFRETKHTSRVSGEYVDEYEIRILSEQTAQSARETTVILEKTTGQDLSPVIECEDGSQVTPAHSIEAMETIEPAEENLLLAIRQASSTSKRNVVDSGKSDTVDTVEIAADDDLPDLEIEPPTPIRRSSRRSTPERSVESTRTSRRANRRKDSASTSDENKKGTSDPTPPKLRRLSPRQTAKPSHDDGWSDEMPCLQLEASDDENSNDNRSRSSSLSVPSRRSSRRSVDRSPPPVSPSRRSLRKSAERSPPPSPSRRSSRRSEERSSTPERTGRASKPSTKVGCFLVFCCQHLFLLLAPRWMRGSGFGCR